MKRTMNSIFDVIFDPDLTLDEKIIYYEDLLEEARIKKNAKLEDEINAILYELRSRGDKHEDK